MQLKHETKPCLATTQERGTARGDGCGTGKGGGVFTIMFDWMTTEWTILLAFSGIRTVSAK